MNFAKALEACLSGLKICRDSWKNLHVEIRHPGPGSNLTKSYLCMVQETDGAVESIPWHPSHVEIFAENWMIKQHKQAPATLALAKQQEIKLYAYKNTEGSLVYMENKWNGNGILKRWPAKDRVA